MPVSFSTKAFNLVATDKKRYGLPINFGAFHGS
jgi:hypothetical protein